MNVGSEPPQLRPELEQGVHAAQDRHHHRSRSSFQTNAQLSRKVHLLTRLLIDIDILIVSEVCVLYYMEVSISRFILRVLSQYLFLTPKPLDAVLSMPPVRLHLLAVLIPNATCMALHILHKLPLADISSHGYLHGGVMVDFIGQKAPTSSLPLLLLDLVILVLQCLIIAVHWERHKLRLQLDQTLHPGQNVAQATDPEGSVVETAPLSPPPFSSQLSQWPRDDTDNSGYTLRTPILAEFDIMGSLRQASRLPPNRVNETLNLGNYTAALASLAGERALPRRSAGTG